MLIGKTINIIMKLIAIFAVFITVSAEPKDIYCCNNTQVLLDSTGECFDNITNTTTRINFGTCNEIAYYPNSVLNFSVTDVWNIQVVLEDTVHELEQVMFCVANETAKEKERHLVLCTELEKELLDTEVVAYCMLVSVVFWALTALIYSILPELRDLFGKSIINFCISSALGHLILSIMKTVPYEDMTMCAVRGFFVYFFLMASFFWTSCISYQILRKIRQPAVPDYGWQQFIWAALYSWGIPAILTILLIMLNYIPGSHLRPGIGLNTCWFFSKKHQWYYMFSIMTILLIANVCMFVYVFRSLWDPSFSSTHIKAVKYRFGMTVRMVIVMGLPWIFEMISSLTNQNIIWVALDIFNALQGPVIFLILVVLRRRVLKALHKRGLLYCLTGAIEKYLPLVDDEEEILENAI